MDEQLLSEAMCGDWADDGTDPEDLAIYLEGLAQYREWYLRDTTGEYLGRLEMILRTFEDDLAVLDRLMALPEGEFLAGPAYRDQALWRLFHAMVVCLEVSKWLLTREAPRDERPRSFSEAFHWLAGKGVLPADGFPEYMDLCRLRNRFAHGLGEMPAPAEARGLIRRWLPDLRAVAAHLRAGYL